VDVAESALADAQDKLNKLLNPDPADVALAEANLADAQDKLDHLRNGADPRDLAVAQARLEAVQAAVSALTLTAPFEGEVLAVNCQPGDAVAPAQAAVTLANRRVLRVEAQLDEADMGQIAVGQPVSVTFETLPGVVLAGQVTWIDGNGTPVQGVVKYTVRVEMPQSEPRVLLGMTANVSILTQRQAGALAVPPGAVLRDEQGEFVNRIRDGQVERVNVISGQVQNGLLVVAGALQPGDEVQLPNGRLP
jgi:HlyD family secretion protein